MALIQAALQMDVTDSFPGHRRIDHDRSPRSVAAALRTPDMPRRLHLAPVCLRSICGCVTFNQDSEND
jgi:hypothetical protein